jgi:hypothetical protein
METLPKTTTTKKASEEINNAILTPKVDTSKVKLSKLERLNNALKKAQGSNANAWDKLGGASAETQLDMFSLSKISNVFCSSSFVDEIQRNILTFGRIKMYVNNTPKYQNKVVFNANDVKLICNAILKAEDTRVKIAVKVAKQGGEIKQK